MTDERREHRWRDNLDTVGIFIAIIVSVAAALVVHSAQSQLDEQERQIGVGHRQLVDACNRLQILRVQDNVSHRADYQVFKLVWLESRAAVASGRVPAAQRRVEREFLSQLRLSYLAKTWTPRTNCAVAVAREGSHYKPPRPVHFEDPDGTMHLPPAAALTVPANAYRRQ